MKKNLSSLILLFLTLTFGLSTPHATAAEITVIENPAETLNTVLNGTTICLQFKAKFEGSTSTIAHIEIGFNETAWNYEGFYAEMEETNITLQFNETILDGTLNLTATEIDPKNGILTITVNFTAQQTLGNYTFSWKSIYSAAPPLGPEAPCFESKNGTTSVTVVPEFPSAKTLLLLILTSLIIAIFSKQCRKSFIQRQMKNVVCNLKE